MHTKTFNAVFENGFIPALGSIPRLLIIYDYGVLLLEALLIICRLDILNSNAFSLGT